MISPGDPAAAKAALRARLQARRRVRPAAERVAAGAAVTAALLGGLPDAGVVAAFVPDEDEPDIGRLLDALGGRLLLPVVPAGNDELRWAVHHGELTPGRFGLLEPGGPRMPPEALGTAAAVVVPALAVDRTGARLGRGRGYYDRALRHVAPGAVLVAVVHDDELLDDVPAEPHDRRVHAVVTPSGGWQELPGASG